MKLFKTALIFTIILLNLTTAKAEERYSCIEIKTDLEGDKLQYSINKENIAEFEIKDCTPQNIKISIKNMNITYDKSERLIENGQIERNDLFSFALYYPVQSQQDSSLLSEKDLYLNFYIGRITSIINPAYPLYPTLKQTAERLKMETPHRVFIIFSRTGSANHEFFCYEQSASQKPSQDSCQYSFEQVLELHAENKNTVALGELAEKYLKRLDYDRVEKIYKKLFEISDRKDTSQLINFYFATRQYDKAKEILLKELEDFPYEPSTYLNLAELYLNEKDFDNAESFAQKALKFRFDDGRYKAYKVFGEVSLARREFKDAIQHFLQTLEYLRKECEMRSIFEQYLRRQDINTGYCDTLALPYQLKIIHALIELEEFDRAEKLLNGLLTKNHDEPFIYGHLAYLYAGKGKFNRALQMTDRAESLLKQRGIGAEFTMGEVYPVIVSVSKNSPASRVGLKRGDRVINIDGRDLRLFREEGDILNMLIDYLNQNDRVRLTIHSENSTELKDVEIVPEKLLKTQASQVLALKALILRAERDHRGFERLSSKAYELNPEDRLVLAVRALALADKKRYDEAVKIIEELERSGRDSFTLLIKPLVYAKSGKMEKARRYYREIPEELLKTKNALYKNLLVEIRKVVHE